MNWDRLEFAHAHLLWLLLLPLALLLWKGRRGQPAALRLPTTVDAAVRGHPPRSAVGGLRLLPALLALALGIVALARPRLGTGSTEIESSGIDIVLTLDVSDSMEAMDFKLEGEPVNRLEAVKDVVAKFIKARPGDQIGAVAFAGQPYVICPVISNHEFLASCVANVKIGQVEGGTAIGSAISASVNHLKQSKARSRIIILLTDGVNTAGGVNPETGAEAAAALGMKIYAIGAGTMGEAPMPVRGPFGDIRYSMQKVEIDEAMLKKVAEKTGGQYFRATDTTSLERIYESINELEKTPRREKKYEDFEELYLYPLIPAIALLLGCWLLSHTLWRRLP
jgi:Ca-activated chloride channel family protein